MRKLFFTIILISLILTTYVFAATKDFNFNVESEESIVSVSSKSVGLKEDFYVILNLNKISYNKFKVDITNTSKMSANELTTNDISNLSTNNVATTFVVDKATLNLERLGIIFTAPEIETTIKFEVRITSLDTNVDELNNNLNLIIDDITELKSSIKILEDNLAKLDESIENYNTLKNETLENLNTAQEVLKEKENQKMAIEEKINSFSNQSFVSEVMINVSEKQMIEKEFNEEMQELEKKQEMSTKNMQKLKTEMNELETTLKNANERISSLTQNETYQGSQNNYLKSLEVTGYSFESDFKKTTKDYFITVDENVKKVNVKAVAEDSSAIITIYGNDNLKTGKNKILINITADDGSIRTYRIYVTK